MQPQPASPSWSFPAIAAEWRRRADACRAGGDLHAAIDLYGRSMEMSPPNTALLFLRGSTHLQLGEREAAARDFEAALSLDPENEAVRGLLARASEPASGEADLASEGHSAAAEQLQRQADRMRAKGDLPEAIRLYGEAIAASPPNTALFYLRGTARLESGDPAAAIADLEAALRLDKMNVPIITLLREARSALRRPPRR